MGNMPNMTPRWLKATIGATAIGIAHYGAHALTTLLNLAPDHTVMAVTAVVVTAYFALRMLL